MYLNEVFLYLLILTIMLLLINMKNYLRTLYLAFTLPGPPALPVLGNVSFLNDSKKMEQFAINAFNQHGPVFRCWISIIPFFFVTEPEHIQIVFGTNKNSEKNGFYSLLHNFLGEGLITSRGERWKRNRKLLQPCFQTKIFEIFFKSFYQSSTDLVKKLKNKKDINIAHLVNQYVMDVICETVIGSAKLNISSSPFRKGKVLLPDRIKKPWLLLDFVFSSTKEASKETEQKESLKAFTREILERKHKLSGQNVDSGSTSLMSLMIEISKENPCFTDEDIVNETCTFMLAGQDSVGAAIVFSLYFLAKHQNVQAKVVEELKSIFTNENRKTTFEDIHEMKYLEQCIKEAMRLCPSVPILTRKLTRDVRLGKYELPKGANIFMSPFLTHRMAHVFPDPLKYDPDRFSSENQSKIHNFAYLPFSIGPRICIGNKYAMIEMKTVVSEILRNYEISVSPDHEELNLSYRITLRASGGIWLRFSERNLT